MGFTGIPGVHGEVRATVALILTGPLVGGRHEIDLAVDSTQGATDRFGLRH